MRIVVIVGKFAPFHLSRLEAAGKIASLRGDELIGIEVASLQSEYGWKNSNEKPCFFVKDVLFDGRDYWQIKGNEIRREVFRKLDQVRPDVLVLSGYSLAESRAALRWALRHRVPRVLISDTHRLGRGRGPIWRVWLKKMLVSCFQAAVVGGQPQCRYLESMGLPPDRMFQGSTVIDGRLFARELPDNDSRSGAFRVLTCARLIKEKNLPFVLKAMAAHSTGWTWSIVGAGPEERRIRELIGQFRLSERVTLLGHVDYEDLPRTYAAFDAYLQPSISEQWGLVVNEAMFAGLPVVVSRRCGCSEDLVREGVNGFLFDPTNEDDFVQAMEQLKIARSRWLDMGRESQRIVADWDLDRFARSLLQACDIATTAVVDRRIVVGMLGRFLT